MKFNFQKTRELVEASPIKEKVIAKACTIEHKTLQQYLRGNGGPSPAVLRLLAQQLGVPEESLLEPNEDSKAS